MKLIKTKKDTFKDSYGFIHHFNEVPCIVYEEFRDFGCMGDGYAMEIHLIPKKVKCIKSYYKGFKAAR